MLQQQMSKVESRQAAVAGTVSPKHKRVRSKSRSSGERCMSDQSDTDMDTSVRLDQHQATNPTPMLVDIAHSESAEQAATAGKSWLIFSPSCSPSSLYTTYTYLTYHGVDYPFRKITPYSLLPAGCREAANCRY